MLRNDLARCAVKQVMVMGGSLLPQRASIVSFALLRRASLAPIDEYVTLDLFAILRTAVCKTCPNVNLP